MGGVVKALAVVAIIVAATALAGPLGSAIATLGVSAAIATAIATTVLTIAAGIAIQKLGLVQGAPTAKANLTPTIIRQSITDSFILYGRRRVVNLKLVFFHSKKVGKRHYRYFAFAIAGHRIAGNPAWRLNDEAVTVDGAGLVTSGTYAGKVWLWLQRGLAAETANATFVAECGGKWTAAHKGNGVAMIYMKAEMSDEVVEAGLCMPSPDVDGKDDILDPRTATTGYTNNAALVFYDWLKLPREEGGYGAYPDEIPDDDWISAQANVCDEAVEGEPRYALNGFFVTGANPGEMREVLIVNCAGSYTYSGGKHLMRPGYWVPPSATLSEDDLAGPIQVSPFLPGDAAANEVQGTYVEPADKQQGAPFATQTTSPAPADVKQLDLDLAFTTSKHQAERVAAIMLKRAQAEKTVAWPMNIVGIGVKALDTVQCATVRYGLSNYAFVVTGWGLTFGAEDVGVVLSLREENEDIYAAPAAAAPPSVPAIDLATPFLLERQAAVLIAHSHTEPTRMLEAVEAGGSVTVTVLAHDRVYPDGVRVAIAEQVFAGLSPDFEYVPYYDDLDRSDTTPTIVMNTDPSTAQEGAERHALGRIRTPVSGSGETFLAGGVLPTGSMIGGEIP